MFTTETVIFFLSVIASSALASDVSQSIPMIKSADPFDAAASARILKNAMSGSKPNSDAIIEVLTKCVLKQRLEIDRDYTHLTGKKFMDDLYKQGFSLQFNNLMKALMTPLEHFYVEELHDVTVYDIGDIFTEIVFPMSNNEIQTVSNLFRETYNKPLEEHINNYKSGDFKKLVVQLLKANRDESKVIDEAKAIDDANALHQAGNVAATFIEILASRSFQQIHKIALEYTNSYNQNLEDVINKTFSGDFKTGLLAIAQIARSKYEFFADRLSESLKNVRPADDRTLIRIIVSRSEIDLGNIAKLIQDPQLKDRINSMQFPIGNYPPYEIYKSALVSLIDNQ